MNALIPDAKKRLSVLQRSPLDDDGNSCGVEAPGSHSGHWVPSRFNVRATSDDGRLVLWNTLSTAICAFDAEHIPQVISLLKAGGYESELTGITGYLVDKGFLVKKGTDEYRKFLHAFGKQHYRSDRLELIMLASEDCNFRCTYCYEKFKRGTMQAAVREGIKRLVEKRIESLALLGTSWFGGEPLYGWDAIADVAPFVARLAAKHGVPFYGNMTTNAFLLTPDVADSLLEWRVNSFQITLDGAPENHDCSRPTREGTASFATIHQNLRAMAARRDEFRVRLRVNFTPDNASGMERFMDLLQTDFRDDPRFGLSFHPVGKWGGENDENLAVCTKDESRSLIEAMKSLAEKRGLGFFTFRESNILGGQVCYAARPYNFIIGASGKVMKCTVVLDTDERNIVGQLQQNGQLDLIDDTMALWTEPTFTRDEQCQKCVALPSCQGISCPLPRIEKAERPCVPTRTFAKDEAREMLRYGAFKKKLRAPAVG